MRNDISNRAILYVGKFFYLFFHFFLLIFNIRYLKVTVYPLGNLLYC